MSETNTTYVQVDQGSGEVQFFHDPFAAVDRRNVDHALEIENRIRQEKASIESSFLKIAFYLNLFDQERLYLARGYESFRQWCDSSDIDISYRRAIDLVRLVRDAYPMLPGGEEDQMHLLSEAGVSKARELLPLLNAGKTEAFVELIAQAPELTWRDLRKEVKTVLGQEADPTDENAFFKLRAERHDTVVKVTVTCHDGRGSFPCGVLTVPHGAALRFLNRFGGWEGDLS